jgi:hypothetical protein
MATTYEEAFASYEIHPKFWPGMLALILAQAKPTAELQVRLDYVENYRDCLRDLTAGTRQQPKLTPAIEPFESIEVQNEQPDRFPGPCDRGG